MSTPILDGETPFPPAPSRSGLVSLFVIVGVALTVFVISLLDDSPSRPSDSIDTASGTEGVWLLLAVPAALFVSILIHESGHVIAGLAVGFRFRSVRVGPIEFGRVNGVRLHRYNLAGQANLAPTKADGFVARSLVWIAAGPTANIALAAAIPHFGDGVLASSLFAVNLIVGLTNLLPVEFRGQPTDGSHIWQLLTHRDRQGGLYAITKLADDWNEGALPESLSPDLIAKAVEAGDRSARLRVSARWFAYVHEAYRDNPFDAARHLEVCLQSVGDLHGHVRQAFIAEAAVFQGQRGRVDLAERWRKEVTAFPASSAINLQLDAAILQGSGRNADACVKLDEVKTCLLKEPDSPARIRNLTLLARWRAIVAPDSTPA